MFDIIQADYERLEAAATQFGQQGQAIEQMRQRVQRVMERLQSGWMGAGSEAFFEEMESDVLPGVHRLAEALKEANRKTAQISRILQSADQDAAAPFGSGPSASSGVGVVAGRPDGGGFAGGGHDGVSDDIPGGGLEDYGGISFPLDPGSGSGAGGVWSDGGFYPADPDYAGLDQTLSDYGFDSESDLGGPISAEWSDGLDGGGGLYDPFFDGEGSAISDYLNDGTNDWGIPEDWLAGVDEGIGSDFGDGVSPPGSDSGDAAGGEGGSSDGGAGLENAGPASSLDAGAGSGGDSGAPAAGGTMPEATLPSESLPTESRPSEPLDSGAGGGSGGSPMGDSGTGGGGGSPLGGGGMGGGPMGSGIGGATGGTGDIGGGAGISTGEMGTSEAAPMQSGPMRFQSLGGSSAEVGVGRAGWSPIGGGEIAGEAPETGKPSLIPMGLAAITPFLALLGKAVRERSDDR